MKTMHCIDRVSPFSGNTNSMFMLLDVADSEKWRSGGGCIQDIMPYLSADEREFLMTGIMPEEWGQATDKQVGGWFVDFGEEDE